ncbi:hypothetical protein Hdeb2414_s0045g00746201 [Helianthus debilis subsp. tardiflorus]
MRVDFRAINSRPWHSPVDVKTLIKNLLCIELAQLYYKLNTHHTRGAAAEQGNYSIAITIHFRDQYIQRMSKCRPHWVMLCRLSIIR